MASHDPLPVPDAVRELPSFTEVEDAALWLEPSGPLPFRVTAPRERPPVSCVERRAETTDAGLVRYAEPNAVNAAALRGALGPYKPSLHSGLDKFSVYPLVAEATEGVVHLKKAGTGYPKALCVASVHEPELFREIYALGCERYHTERQSYHVSASLSRVPAESDFTDAELPALLDQDDARQVPHVTFGSALDRYRDALLELLQTEQGVPYDALTTHFEKHLTPFSAYSRLTPERSA